MSRGHVEIGQAPEIEPVEPPAAGWPSGARARILWRDRETAALTPVLELPAGYRRPPGHLTAEAELVVLSGTLPVAETVRETGHYEYTPAGGSQQASASEGGCELLLMAVAAPPTSCPRGAPRERRAGSS